MNRNKARLGAMILPILAMVAICVTSCAESDSRDPSRQSDRSDTSRGQFSQTGNGDSHDSGDMVEVEADVSFEEQVVRRYSLLMSRVPIADIDSIIQTYMKRDAQPRQAGRKAQRDFQAYMDRQDSAVRKTVAGEFDISVDSLETLIGRRVE